MYQNSFKIFKINIYYTSYLSQLVKSSQRIKIRYKHKLGHKHKDIVFESEKK